MLGAARRTAAASSIVLAGDGGGTEQPTGAIAESDSLGLIQNDDRRLILKSHGPTEVNVPGDAQAGEVSRNASGRCTHVNGTKA